MVWLSVGSSHTCLIDIKKVKVDGIVSDSSHVPFGVPQGGGGGGLEDTFFFGLEI